MGISKSSRRGDDTAQLRTSRALRTKLKVLAASQERSLFELTNEALSRYIEEETASRSRNDSTTKDRGPK